MANPLSNPPRIVRPRLFIVLIIVVVIAVIGILLLQTSNGASQPRAAIPTTLVGSTPTLTHQAPHVTIGVGGTPPTAPALTVAATPTALAVGSTVRSGSITVVVEQSQRITWRDQFNDQDVPQMVVIVQVKNMGTTPMRWPADMPAVHLLSSNGAIRSVGMPIWGQVGGRVANMGAVAVSPDCAADADQVAIDTLLLANQSQMLLPGDALRTLLAIAVPDDETATTLAVDRPNQLPILLDLHGVAAPMLAPALAELPAPPGLTMRVASMVLETRNAQVLQLPGCAPMQRVVLHVSSSASIPVALPLPIAISADGARWTTRSETLAFLAAPGEHEVAVLIPDIGAAKHLVFRFGNPTMPTAQLVVDLP